MAAYWSLKTQDAMSAALAKVDNGWAGFSQYRQGQYLCHRRAAKRWLRWYDQTHKRAVRGAA